MIPTPNGLIPWATRIMKILAKKYPPNVEPIPDRKPHWEKFSNWALICEDILDTEPDPRFLRMCYDELLRRGLDDSTIQEMHRLAWLTAGWLNYEKLLWEWVQLDQEDMERAVEWQFKDGLINEEDRRRMIEFIKKHGGGQPLARDMMGVTNKELPIVENDNILNVSWGRCWKSIDAAGDGDALMQRLLTAYDEPHRKYHTIQHLTESLLLLDENLGLAIEPAEVEIALWFHDAIYDVNRVDNETQSGEWAARELQQADVSSLRIARVKDNILATRHSAPPQGQDQMLLVDIDLSILGAPRARFEEYERQVRAEYEWIPSSIFSRKRRKVLLAFLSRNAIYHTPQLHEAFEDQARANLAYSVQQLRS